MERDTTEDYSLVLRDSRRNASVSRVGLDPEALDVSGGGSAIVTRVRLGLILGALGLLPLTVGAQQLPDLVVENPCGGVRLRVRAVSRVEIETTRNQKPIGAPNVDVERLGGYTRIRCKPDGTGAVDLDLVLPYRLLVEASTVDGAIEYEGFGQAVLRTVSGKITAEFPWEATRFALESKQAPDEFRPAVPYRQVSKVGPWIVGDRAPEGRVSWGALAVHADRPRLIELRPSGGIPAESPVKMHWQAREMLPRLFRRFGAGGLRRRDGPSEPPKKESEATFSADVRLVQLDVAALDKKGRPVTDLRPDDFEVTESGERQGLVSVSTVETPFNLVLLLDCSSSTEGDRKAIEEAARNFVDVARPQDRVGAYALGDTLFQVLTRLTLDHDLARNSAEGLGIFSGATPLYDSIVLAYAEELARLPRRRNALVVITDGMDNRFSTAAAIHRGDTKAERPSGAPSTVSFDELKNAAEEMDATIYPILLDPAAVAAKASPDLYDQAVKWRSTVRERAERLAAASGGRVFHARSLRDLKQAYGRVAEELRSVYTLSYRPKDQDFDGEWRSVRVTTPKSGAVLRTRPGYYGY